MPTAKTTRRSKRGARRGGALGPGSASEAAQRAVSNTHDSSEYSDWRPRSSTDGVRNQKPMRRGHRGREKLHVLTSSHDLDDYDIISSNTMSIAVPHRASNSFRKLLWAAMVTYGFGNTSVDHVLRRYGPLWERTVSRSLQGDPRLAALREIVNAIKQIARELDRVKPIGSGPICARAALVRLEASFKAAYGLVRRAYVFETDAVVRLILEQMAWAYAAHGASEKEIFHLAPNKCISRLKKLLPRCGTLYGLLNRWAHIDPSLAQNYLEFHRAAIDVVRRSAFNSFESGEHIAVLAVAYLDLAQELFSPLSSENYGLLRKELSDWHKRYSLANAREPVDQLSS
jgi:hypothetical protein